MPQIDLSILNQRQTPAFYADVLANRPAAGFIGRIFVSTNTFEFYRDNGTGWDLIGGPGAGTITGSGATGQVTYWNGASTVTGDNGLFYDSVNDRLGIGTITPGAAIDAHSTQNIVLQLNQTTATNNTKIAFQNSGTALWRIGNNFGGGTNSFVITDAALNINRFSVLRTSGQTFVGDVVTSSGLFVVNSNSGDAHIVALGATAPSIRVRNAGTGATLQFGLGLATTTNNFIQGSTGGEFCIFNDSLTAQPILFGIKDAGSGNTLEAARISAARNFLIGTTTDAGFKLDINGTARIQGNLTLSAQVNAPASYQTNMTGGNIAFFVRQNIIATNDNILQLQPSSTNGASVIEGLFSAALGLTTNSSTAPIIFAPNRTERARIFSATGNVAINSTTDSGFKLDVNGSLRVGAVNESFSTSLSGIASRLFYVSQSVQGIIYANPQNTTQFGYCLPFSIGFITNTAGADTVIGTSVNLGASGGACQYYAGNNSLINGHRFFYSNAERVRIGNFNTIISDTGTISSIASALLQLDSTTRGFLPPRMTTAQKNAIANLAAGLVVYDTTLNKLSLYTGATWETVTSV